MDHYAVLCVGTLMLGAFLSIACWSDFETRRIPNTLITSGVLLGLLLQIALPRGNGLFTTSPGGLGGIAALYGCAVGIATMLPLYVISAMGAGDVKMMGMVGIFLGPAATIDVVVITLVAGGVLSVAVAIWTGVLKTVVCNVRQALLQSVVSVIWMRRGYMHVDTVAGITLPYAFAISAGTLIQILLARSGYTLFA